MKLEETVSAPVGATSQMREQQVADQTPNQTADTPDEQQNPEVTDTTDTTDVRKPPPVRSEGQEQVVFVQPPSYHL